VHRYFGLRTKLILAFSLVIIIGVFLSVIIGIQLIGNTIIKQAQDKVRLDLNSAREVYQKESECIKKLIRLTSLRFFLIDAILKKNSKRIEEELQKIRLNESLDILNLVDKEGNVLVRARNPASSGDKLDDEVMQWVLKNKKAVVTTKILSRSVLEKEGTSLVEQVTITLVPTPKARTREDTVETSGMAIIAAAPIFDYGGNIIGVLYGGKVLNRNYEIVDTVKDIVYRGEQHKGRDIGTATIFQDDLRVATNVRTLDGNRAIGTRVSEEVYDQVIGKGLPWIGRAFVVNAWYITAYEPIRNIQDEIVGMLYVGMLEAPYVDLRRRVIFIFLGIAAIAVILLSVIAFFTTNMITGPIKKLVFATRRVAEGDLSYRVQGTSNDEIGELARSFNGMTESLSRAERELKDWAKTLEEKVEERTIELQQTQRQLIRSEKLASLGKMAAGVAHEINNPLTAVLTFSKLMLDDLEPGDKRREDLQTIVDETLRCRDIVRGLLDFSRETESKKRLQNINEVIENTLSLVQNQAMFHDIAIKKNLEKNLPVIPLDEAKMKQVFMNMFLNAAEAMSGRGTLTIGTVREDEHVAVRIKDTGCGIPKEHLNKLFDPFFTTKRVGKGTGLGLAVTYGIVKSHEGTFEVKSKVGKGTEFLIRFPIKLAQPRAEEDGTE
jgi:two-component system NtrC family sensor kinase